MKKIKKTNFKIYLAFLVLLTVYLAYKSGNNIWLKLDFFLLAIYELILLFLLLLSKNYDKKFFIFKVAVFTTIFVFFYLAFLYHFWLTLFSLLILFSVAIHELGHLFFMKKAGVKVVEYAIGFGPEIYGFNYKDIHFSFRALPLGGYVKPIDDVKNIRGKEQDYLRNKTFLQKLGVYIGGVLMNFIFAIVLLLVIFLNFSYFILQAKKQFSNIPQTLKEKYIKEEVKKIKRARDLKQFCDIKNSIWLGDEPNRKDSIVELIAKETINAVKLNICGIKYALEKKNYNNIGTIVYVGKEIKKHEYLMNFLILLLIVSFVNLSLGTINLLPFPGLDGRRIIKSSISHLFGKILSIKPAIIENSFLIVFIESLGMYFLMGVGILLILRDLFFG